MAGKLLERLRPKKQFIGVARDTLPAELADAVDNLHWACTRVGKIAAMEN